LASGNQKQRSIIRRKTYIDISNHLGMDQEFDGQMDGHKDSSAF